MTVYGAIGNCLNRPIVYRFEKGTTNAEDYMKFLKEDLLPAIVNTQHKPVLVFDQHKAHSKEDVLLKAGTKALPLPQVSYSSNFNSVETVWSIAKKNFFKRRLFDKYKLTEAEFLAHVRESLESIPPNLV